MEILGRNIPTLQNAISSGLESVSAGILESVKASGGAALGIAQDSFSFEQMGTATSADLPAASGVADYPAPDQYFRRYPGTASDSPVSSLAISKTLSDPNFNAPKSLQTFSNSSVSMVDSAMKAFRARSEHEANLSDKLGYEDLLGDIYGSAGRKREGGSLLRTGTYPADDRYGREKADGTSLDGVSYSAVDRYGQDERSSSTQMWMNETLKEKEKNNADKADGTSLDGVSYSAVDRYGQAERSSSIRMRMNEVLDEKEKNIADKADKMEHFGDPAYLATDRFGRDKAESTSVPGAVASGSSDSASDRSIIVVCGKTSGTYFQTIDDSVTQLQSNPTQETANLFAQQFNAVTDMMSTVARTVDLQQSLTLNQFTALR